MDLNEIINKSLKLINNKNFSEALDLLNQISVKDHQVFFIKGSIYILLNNLELAKENFLSAIKINNNIPSLCELAFLLTKEGNFFEAEKYYKKVLEIDNSNKNAKLGLGHLYLKFNRFQQGHNLIKSINGVLRFNDSGFKIVL